MSKRPTWWLRFLSIIWPITWLSGRAYAVPVIGRILTILTRRLFSKKNLNLSYIPIHQEMSPAESIPLPQEIITALIRRSSHRAIINRCTCRDDRTCKKHPIDLGCMLLGDGAKEIDPRISRHVDIEEAISHLKEAIDNGLIPLIGRARIDNFLYGVRDRGRLLTICFCCRCCCTIFASGKYLPEEIAQRLVRLEGLHFTIDHERCSGCGVCVDECFMGALSLSDGKIVKNEIKCKGCGRCVDLCPEGALGMEWEDSKSVIDRILKRIENYITFE
jgi:UDP-glucose 4-epimerase